VFLSVLVDFIKVIREQLLTCLSTSFISINDERRNILRARLQRVLFGLSLQQIKGVGPLSLIQDVPGEVELMTKWLSAAKVMFSSLGGKDLLVATPKNARTEVVVDDKDVSVSSGDGKAHLFNDSTFGWESRTWPEGEILHWVSVIMKSEWDELEIDVRDHGGYSPTEIKVSHPLCFINDFCFIVMTH
jgi:hypothetical protein